MVFQGVRSGQELQPGLCQFGLQFLAVLQDNCNLVRVVDHMVVGDDKTVGAHDDAGAERALTPLARRAAKEIANFLPRSCCRTRVK